MDEKPIQFLLIPEKDFVPKRAALNMRTMNISAMVQRIFLFTEPLAWWRFADAQEHRTRQDWAKQIEWLLTEQYPKAKKVVLVMDNLNTHNIASLYATFPSEYASMLAERL